MYVTAPCGTCPAKGCGSYHDECKAYQKYKETRKAIENGRVKNSNINGYVYTNMTKMLKRKNEKER